MKQQTSPRGAVATGAGALALVLTLTACGGGRADDAAQDAAQAGETVSVETDYGTVDIPADPQRVVALEFGTEVVLEAGIEPVGVIEPVATLYTAEEFEKLSQYPVVQSASLELNLEAIAEARPDLIIGGVRVESHDEYAATREDLEQIAPTVFYDFDGAGAGLRDMTLELSRAVGDGERATEEQERFDSRVEEIRTTYADQLADTTFAVVFGSDGEFAVDNTNAWGGEILDTLGARQTEAQRAAGENFAAFYSYEEIDQLSDADVIFYETDAAGQPDPFTEALLDQELWQDLPAVEAGQSHPLRYSAARTYAQANTVLDQVEEVLADL
ncbi:ABC transporter substrate-binding protein [Thermobifida halotolerans]|uniref:ABC transporter substrate-binding protein n=1 Tax=Thermobifida halotolerans TaxID=483545 RepID=A0AA97M643_9ACTN|nr:ABC transporter substrate-binding protein [Thermobifida halotolerans]UOE21647.1 ABC transporter substrate-binding protein [Thermobifida halotolerans]